MHVEAIPMQCLCIHSPDHVFTVLVSTAIITD